MYKDENDHDNEKETMIYNDINPSLLLSVQGQKYPVNPVIDDIDAGEEIPHQVCWYVYTV